LRRIIEKTEARHEKEQPNKKRKRALRPQGSARGTEKAPHSDAQRNIQGVLPYPSGGGAVYPASDHDHAVGVNDIKD
jgi:hypothetical protein